MVVMVGGWALLHSHFASPSFISLSSEPPPPPPKKGTFLTIVSQISLRCRSSREKSVRTSSSSRRTEEIFPNRPSLFHLSPQLRRSPSSCRPYNVPTKWWQISARDSSLIIALFRLRLKECGKVRISMAGERAKFRLSRGQPVSQSLVCSIDQSKSLLCSDVSQAKSFPL